jgi:hypothetical protein
MDYYTSILGLTVIYGIELIEGMFIIHCFFGSNISSLPFFIKFPLYIASGITVLIPTYFIAAIFKVHPLIPIIVSFGTILAAIHKTSILISIKVTCKYPFMRNKNRALLDEFLSLLLFIVTSCYFIWIVNYMMWPPAGDIITATAPLVSLIQFAGKLPLEPSPILILYPPGFHILTAMVNELLRLYPAEAVFLMGASIIIQLPILIYSLTYIITRSKIFSIIAFLSTFLIHPSGNLEKWLVGYFFNGVYPALCGFYIVLSYISMLSLFIIDDKRNSWIVLKRKLMLSFIYIISLVLSYPPFALLIIFYTLLSICMYWKLIWLHLKQTLKSINTLLILIISFTLLLFSICYLFLYKYYTLVILISYLKGSYFPGGEGIGGKLTMYSYLINWQFFIDNINGATILVTYLVSIIGMYAFPKLKNFDPVLFYILTTTLILVSIHKSIYEYIFYITPSRSIIILATLSWPLLFSVLRILYNKKHLIIFTIKISVNKKNVMVKKITSFGEIILVITSIIIAIIVFIPNLSAYLSPKQIDIWSWFTRMPTFKDDFAALEWINKNINNNDLILNDGSHISNYLLGLSIKNLTHHPWAQFVYTKRFKDLQKIWQNPKDEKYILETLKKYNVRYILLTSEWGYQLYGENFGYYAKPYSAEEYARIFDQYPFLQVVFKSGSTRVYKVILTNN